jgi:hypothetical protein
MKPNIKERTASLFPSVFLAPCCLLLVPLFMGACVGPDVSYRPASQILPSHIKALAVRPFVNKTQQFGLEDRLTRRTVDEFLRDGEFPIKPEDQADGVLIGEITRYILTPIQYDAALVPTSYKLTVIVNLQVLDRTTNTYLWTEPNFVVDQIFAASTRPGGMTELQAQYALWDVFSRNIVSRVIQGFGTVTGASQRKIAPEISSGTVTSPETSTGTVPSPSNP